MLEERAVAEDTWLTSNNAAWLLANRDVGHWDQQGYRIVIGAAEKGRRRLFCHSQWVS